jgi:1-acyl-sn-glycerol-3-phosphate acyltransferase
MVRPADSMVWYPLAQRIARWGLAPLVRTRFEGLENLPAAGPCLLVPNHQSILDPLILQSGLSRQVDSMTKSTQFSGLFFRWFLPRIHAFPVRRYRIDPQSVRVALRRLEEGRAVCVYPEGERSWDGRLQPLRRGTLRLILRAGVPVVPIGIDGTFRTWPRWARRPRRGFTAHVRIGKPIHFGTYVNRQEREAALPETERLLRQALLELSGEAARTAMRPPPGVLGLRPDVAPPRAAEPAPSRTASRPHADER